MSEPRLQRLDCRASIAEPGLQRFDCRAQHSIAEPVTRLQSLDCRAASIAEPSLRLQSPATTARIPGLASPEYSKEPESYWFFNTKPPFQSLVCGASIAEPRLQTLDSISQHSHAEPSTRLQSLDCRASIAALRLLSPALDYRTQGSAAGTPPHPPHHRGEGGGPPTPHHRGSGDGHRRLGDNP